MLLEAKVCLWWCREEEGKAAEFWPNGSFLVFVFLTNVLVVFDSGGFIFLGCEIHTVMTIVSRSGTWMPPVLLARFCWLLVD